MLKRDTNDHNTQRHLDQFPLAPVLLDGHTTLLIQTDSSSVDDCSCQNRRLRSRQSFTLVLCCCAFTSRYLSRRIHKLFERDVAVTLLAIEIAVLVGRVFDVKGVVLKSAPVPAKKAFQAIYKSSTHIRFTRLVLNNVVTTVCLVHPDLTLSGHVVESLFRVHTSF